MSESKRLKAKRFGYGALLREKLRVATTLCDDLAAHVRELRTLHWGVTDDREEIKGSFESQMRRITDALLERANMEIVLIKGPIGDTNRLYRNGVLPVKGDPR